MLDEILRALLWRSRLSVRAGGVRAFAGHGYVDPSYRPPTVPYVSVVGPLSLAVEPERENGKPGQALIGIPGHIIGVARPDDVALPDSGALELRFDGRAVAVLSLTGLPVAPFGTDATGPAVAAAIAGAIAAAVANHQIVDDAGEPLDDPDVDAALARVAVRWSPETRQLAISSGASGGASAVEVLPIAGDLAPLLGWSVPAVKRSGRHQLHRLPAPRAVTIEVRVDLWTSSQGDMAQMFDAFATTTSTRGSLTLRPSLLATDPAAQATTLELLSSGEPTTAESLVHLEGGDGLSDRARGVQFVATAPAASQSGHFHLSGAGEIAATVYREPLIPNPFFATNPAPAGFAVALGIELDPGAAIGDDFSLLTITRDQGATTVCSLSITVEELILPNAGPTLFGQLVATAALTGAGNVTAEAETRWRIPLAKLEAGGTLHAAIDGASGVIRLWFDGTLQDVADLQVTPQAPIAAPGVTAMGLDLRVTLGSATAPLPRPVRISHLHLLREPVGALDPRVRTSLTRAAQLRPGDAIALATTSDGWRTSDAKALSLVESVDGDTVTLTRPLPSAFARGGALVFQEQCFFYQTGVKRRDDLLNRLYHTSFDYKVSALLEDPNALTSVPLVLALREDVVAASPLGDPGRPRPTRPAPAPGITTLDHDPAHEVH